MCLPPVCLHSFEHTNGKNVALKVEFLLLKQILDYEECRRVLLMKQLAILIFYGISCFDVADL